MELGHALGIEGGDVVTFVGAGGKSTALRRIAEESSETKRIVLSTTTRLGIDQSNLSPFLSNNGQNIIGNEKSNGDQDRKTETSPFDDRT